MSQDLRSLIAAQERAASVAGQRGEKARLLEDADQNIGNQLVIKTLPAPFPLTLPYQSPDRILNLNSASKGGQMMTVFLGATASPISSQGSNGPLPSNFITGVVEFGNGSRFSRAEFDIPIGPVQFPAPNNRTPVDPQSGGMFFSLPAATLRIYARSDANLITPDIFGALPHGFAPNPLDPHRLDPPTPSSSPTASDVLVTAFAGYFTRTSIFPPTKTLWLGQVVAATGIHYVGETYAIPPLASTVRFLRFDVNVVALAIRIADIGSNILDQISLPAGVRSDTYKLPGNAAFFEFVSPTTDPMPAGSILQAIFELDM